MLTGPVTILNWSFPREDIPLSEITTNRARHREEFSNWMPTEYLLFRSMKRRSRKASTPQSDWHSAYLDWAFALPPGAR
jgi:5-methyltetrahydropteroyltriglutamate--homocysteine methyltransferase